MELEQQRQEQQRREQQEREAAMRPPDMLQGGLDMDLGSDHPHFSVDELSQLLGDDVFP